MSSQSNTLLELAMQREAGGLKPRSVNCRTYTRQTTSLTQELAYIHCILCKLNNQNLSMLNLFQLNLQVKNEKGPEQIAVQNIYEWERGGGKNSLRQLRLTLGQWCNIIQNITESKVLNDSGAFDSESNSDSRSADSDSDSRVLENL